MKCVFRSSLHGQVFPESRTNVSLASAIRQIRNDERTDIVVDKSSTRGTGRSNNGAKMCLEQSPTAKNGLASARCPVELVESFLKVVRQDLRASEELSNVTAFVAGPSPHEDCLAEEVFIDDVRGGALEAERVKQARREEVQWCRDMGVWEPVLRQGHGCGRSQDTVPALGAH